MAWFSGVSIVSRHALENTRHVTVVRCTCSQLRQPLDLEKNGVFRLGGDAQLSRYTKPPPDHQEIQYVRVFPDRARVFKHGNDKIVIQVDQRKYEHAQGIDLIVPSMNLTGHFPLLFPGEELMV